MMKLLAIVFLAIPPIAYASMPSPGSCLIAGCATQYEVFYDDSGNVALSAVILSGGSGSCECDQSSICNEKEEGEGDCDPTWRWTVTINGSGGPLSGDLVVHNDSGNINEFDNVGSTTCGNSVSGNVSLTQCDETKTVGGPNDNLQLSHYTGSCGTKNTFQQWLKYEFRCLDCSGVCD